MRGSLETGLAEKYLVDDLPGAALGGARLNGILKRIEAGEPLTALAQSFLSSSGLLALKALTTGQIGLGAFREQAAHERTDRMQRAQASEEQEAAERIRQISARDAEIKARFIAMENNPELRRKREARELRDRFAIGYVEHEHYPRVMSMLRQVANGECLRPDDVAWLSTEASAYWTDPLKQAWHRLEAEALTKAWENEGNLRHAVNASSHWRKAGESDIALKVTEAALTKAEQNTKLRSALTTTRGGAMRDVGRLEEAKALGMQARDLTPADFRPCTLLGAVCIELGDLTSGYRWYQKAESLGAKRLSIDQDLRALLTRSTSKERESIRAFLFAQDPERFAWCAGTLG